MKFPDDGPLTNHDLIKYAKKFKIPHFRGVYMRDTLPEKVKNVECWILNHDSIKSTGTHWTALVKIKNNAWYFDSFGRLPPPLEVKKYLGPKVEISYNYFKYQDFDTYICGQLCLNFLYHFWCEQKELNEIKV